MTAARKWWTIRTFISVVGLPNKCDVVDTGFSSVLSSASLSAVPPCFVFCVSVPRTIHFHYWVPGSSATSLGLLSSDFSGQSQSHCPVEPFFPLLTPYLMFLSLSYRGLQSSALVTIPVLDWLPVPATFSGLLIKSPVLSPAHFPSPFCLDHLNSASVGLIYNIPHSFFCPQSPCPFSSNCSSNSSFDPSLPLAAGSCSSYHHLLWPWPLLISQLLFVIWSQFPPYFQFQCTSSQASFSSKSLQSVPSCPNMFFLALSLPYAPMTLALSVFAWGDLLIQPAWTQQEGCWQFPCSWFWCLDLRSSIAA